MYHLICNEKKARKSVEASISHPPSHATKQGKNHMCCMKISNWLTIYSLFFYCWCKYLSLYKIVILIFFINYKKIKLFNHTYHVIHNFIKFFLYFFSFFTIFPLIQRTLLSSLFFFQSILFHSKINSTIQTKHYEIIGGPIIKDIIFLKYI